MQCSNNPEAKLIRKRRETSSQPRSNVSIALMWSCSSDSSPTLPVPACQIVPLWDNIFSAKTRTSRQITPRPGIVDSGKFCLWYASLTPTREIPTNCYVNTPAFVSVLGFAPNLNSSFRLLTSVCVHSI